jgi:hypothetical protein
MESASCHPSSANIFEVATIYSENLCIPIIVYMDFAKFDVITALWLKIQCF